MARKIINVRIKGDLSKTNTFLKIAKDERIYKKVLEKYGKIGVDALKAATPVDSGETASAWDYEISSNNGIISIAWTNSKVIRDGTPIVILLQYGHGTNKGGYVKGRNFINPAIKPIFDRIAEDTWAEVTKL